jgi:hypothetical protein
MKALLVMLAACGGGDIPGAVVSRGRHIELHAAPELAVCSQSIAHVDDFIDAASAYLDEQPPIVTYYLYDGEVAGGCRIIAQGDEAFDCAHGTTVYAGIWPHYHEVVHAVIASWGRPPAFLVEGIAEGMGGFYPYLTPSQRQTAELEVDSVAFYASNAVKHYIAAADFAVYLLDRFGAPRIRTLSRSMLYLDDSIAIHRAFSDVLGVELDDLIADWHASAAVDARFLPRSVSRCSSPSVATVPWIGSDTLACRDTETSQTLLERAYYPFDIATPGLFAWNNAHPTLEGGFGFEECLTTDLPRQLYGGPHATTVFPLDAGRHVISFDRYSDDPTPLSVDVTWQLVPAQLGADCASAPSYASIANDWVLDFEVPPTKWPAQAPAPRKPRVADAWLRLDVPATPVSAFIVPGTGEICSGTCGAFSQCVPFAKTPGMITAAPGEPLYVHAHATSSDKVVTLTLAPAPP